MVVVVTELATCSLCHLLLGFGVGLLAKVCRTPGQEGPSVLHPSCSRGNFGRGFDHKGFPSVAVPLQTIKEETDGLHEELEFIRLLGTDLIFACGETEKPEVKKSIDEVGRASSFPCRQNEVGASGSSG